MPRRGVSFFVCGQHSLRRDAARCAVVGLSDQQIQNLRLALQASREGKTLILPNLQPAEPWRMRVVANRHYLELAVVLEIWRRWNLPRLFNRLLPKKRAAVAPAAVIAALVAHRCTDPGSKLSAQRWFPRTALPELLEGSSAISMIRRN